MDELFLEDDELKLDFFGEKKKSEPIFEQENVAGQFGQIDEIKKDTSKKLLNNFINSDHDSKDKNTINHEFDTRNINFLLEKFKEENNGIGTTDICVLFSFW
jgi:hypothetical protein